MWAKQLQLSRNTQYFKKENHMLLHCPPEYWLERVGMGQSDSTVPLPCTCEHVMGRILTRIGIVRIRSWQLQGDMGQVGGKATWFQSPL